MTCAGALAVDQEATFALDRHATVDGITVRQIPARTYVRYCHALHTIANPGIRRKLHPSNDLRAIGREV
jgi:hypothetical protein